MCLILLACLLPWILVFRVSKASLALKYTKSIVSLLGINRSNKEYSSFLITKALRVDKWHSSQKESCLLIALSAAVASFNDAV